MRSMVPMAPSRMRMRARVSSHIFFTNSPLRPMMLPTFRTGTMRRKTLSPGHPGHLSAAAAFGAAADDGGGRDISASAAVAPDAGTSEVGPFPARAELAMRETELRLRSPSVGHRTGVMSSWRAFSLRKLQIAP